MLDIKKKFLHRKCWQALEEAAEGSGGVTILEVFEVCVDGVRRDMI